MEKYRNFLKRKIVFCFFSFVLAAAAFVAVTMLSGNGDEEISTLNRGFFCGFAAAMLFKSVRFVLALKMKKDSGKCTYKARTSATAP